MGKKTLYNKDLKRINGKSKPTAVVLAVLFGSWAWLYTFREDWTKLVACLSLIFVMAFLSPVLMWVVAVIVWILVIVDTSIKSVDWYVEYYK